MARPRDSQKSRFFRAESQIHATRPVLDLPQAAKFLDRVVRSTWWADRSSLKRPFLAGKPGHSRCGINQGLIQRWKSDIGILHALAHRLVMTDYGMGASWHGPEFCSIYVKLVQRFLGPETAREVKAAFKENGVKSRVVSQETREKYREAFYARKAATLKDDLAKLVQDLQTGVDS